MPQPAVMSPRGLASVRRPIVVTSEVTVDANATKSPDLLKLKNPTGEHFVIREIRFSLRPVAGTGAWYFTGGAVAAKFDLGTQALTNAHVPVWNFGRYVAREADGAVYGTPNQFQWKLKHPIYVPAGAGLACEFQHRGMVSASIVASVTYLGHSYDGAPPTTVRLPWVASYSSKVFRVLDADSDLSSSADLMNPFDAPVYLERFTGRLNFVRPSTDQNFAFLADRTVFIRMRHSSGVPMVREFTHLRQVFGVYPHSWEQRGTILAPGACYLVDVDKRATTVVPDQDQTVQATIGMVGWRELKLAGGTT